MKIRKYFFTFLILFLIAVFYIVYSYSHLHIDSVDIIKVNDITQSIKVNWNNLKKDNLPGLEYNLDYAVLDINNNVIVATRDNLNLDLSTAIKNRDTIIYLTENDMVFGKIIIYNSTYDIVKAYRFNLLIVQILFIIIIFSISFIYLIYIDKSIFKPFRKLQRFSYHIAQGNLDIPLDMDKNNYFGTFTESFDLMRTELEKARTNEMNAIKSKRELVATLSHDIKTPVASIQAVCDLMIAKGNDDYLKNQFEVINLKAEQINNLITNIFNATLEELQELKVNLEEISSTSLNLIINRSDYNHLCNVLPIKECLIFLDPLRFEQVVDNIISNSYKYANTKIDVISNIYDDYLEIEFKDYGEGINENDIPLITNKYFRSSNAQGKSGTGLGLYITKFLLNKMMGEISFKNNIDGFSVIVRLLIV